MNEKAVINNREYTLVEVVAGLDENKQFILSVDAEGNRFICREDFWLINEALAEPPAPVCRNSTTQEKINLFLSMFRGREDVYARRFYNKKKESSGYAPVCKNEWRDGICDKKAHRCNECPNRELSPLTADEAKAHLMGKDRLCRDVAAIYPMLEDGTTWLLAVDFDEANWKADVSAFCETCRNIGLVPAVERSRSGNGAHVWFFFEEPVLASDARKLGSRLLTQTMMRRHELTFKSYDRLFPSQDTVPTGGFGNLIALPFQGQAQKEGNSLFVDDSFEPYPDQWAFLSTLPKITLEKLDECLSNLAGDGDMGQMIEPSEEKPWPQRWGRKKLTKKDFPIQARLMISNLIYLDKQGFSHAALNAIKRLAAFPNPEFRQKQAMRLSVYKIPRILSCEYEDDGFLGVPRGCMDALTDLLGSYEVPFILEDRRCTGRPIDVSFAGELRMEQKPAAEALLAEDIGVLSATTAFGKTVIGAYLIGHRKVNTLILVHSSALLEQWKKSLEKFLEIHEVLPEQPKKRGRKKKQYLIGQIGAGKDTHSSIVDIAIMQSLFEGKDAEKEVKAFVAEYGMVIVDECHHIAARTFEQVLKMAEPKYVYGLSATPVRKDGHHPIIFMQCGPVRYLVDARVQANKREFSHYVIPRFTRTRLPSAADIQDIYAGIIENETRNEQIVQDALELVRKGRTPIILTERKNHAAQLVAKLEGKVKNVFLLLGSDKQKDKREKLAALQAVPAEESLAVVATGKYIGEGFDEPRLDTLLLAMPISWRGTLAQYAGRLHRSYVGKQEVRIYDYVDIHVPALDRMYHKRIKGYSELGYQVRIDEQSDGASKIYDGREYSVPFEQDLSDAAKSVLIVCPYIQKNRVSALLPTLTNALKSGVRVCVHTRSSVCYEENQREEIETVINMVKLQGIEVVDGEEPQQRYAIIDESIVWYGNIDFLAYARKDSDVLRFENADIAGDLMELVCCNETQLTLGI